MADIKTDCNRVVNIKYLKDLIGSDIQKSDGTTYTIASTYDEKYCPKYSELTGGTYVPVAANGTTPNSDTDGLVIASQYTNNSGTKSNYDANQLVHLEDVSVRYTRYVDDSFTASISNATNMSACEGGTATITCSHKYNRTKKFLDGSCSISSTTSEETTASKTDGVALTTGASWISINTSNNATVPKNASASDTNPSAATRSSKVTVTLTFRGASETPVDLTISQAARSGSYSEHDSYSWTSMSTTASTTSIGCDGGDCGINKSYTLSGTEQKHWVDDCGTEFTATTTSVDASTAKTASTPAMYKSCSVTASVEELDSSGGGITFTYTSGDSTAQTSYGVPAHFGACGGNCNVSLSLTMTDSDTSLTSTKTITQTCSTTPTTYSDKALGHGLIHGGACDFSFFPDKIVPDGYYADLRDGSFSQNLIYCHESYLNLLTTRIVYLSPTSEDWFSIELNNDGRCNELWYGGYCLQDAYRYLYGSLSGYYYCGNWNMFYKFKYPKNYTGGTRRVLLEFYVNGVFSFGYELHQSSST